VLAKEHGHQLILPIGKGFMLSSLDHVKQVDCVLGVETSSSCKMEVAKCPYCINTNVQSKDLEAHMVTYFS
jgi:hypothetical protein